MNNSWIKRKKTNPIFVGSVGVGGDHPISIQSMTNTNTADIDGTVGQIKELEAEGADIVRVSVPDKDCANAFKKIKNSVSVPLVADIHFDYKIALLVADSADCLRINPGNIGKENKVQEIIQAAKDNNIPIRVGVNAGSLEKDLQLKYGEPNSDALVESAMRHVKILEKFNYDNFKLSIKSSIGLGILLMQGIGDTIRISLASDPVDEVKVGWEMLKSLKLRSRGVKIIACPSCSRQNFQVINTVNNLEHKLSEIKQEVTLAVIGCYVNGPGESKVADVGVTGASPKHLIYIKGKPAYKVNTVDLEKSLIAEVLKIAEEKSNTIVAQ